MHIKSFLLRVATAPIFFIRSMAVSTGELALMPFGWSRRQVLIILLGTAAVCLFFRYAAWLVYGHVIWGIGPLVKIGVLALVIVVPFALKGSKPSNWAMAGALMYVASYFISNSWNLAFHLLDPLPAHIAEAVRQIMDGAPVSAYGFALRIDQSNKRLLLAIYCATTFLALSKHDLQARMIWLVLTIAEGFSFLEHFECKLWRDPLGSQDYHLAARWGIEVSRYACGRAFTSWAPFMPPAVTALYMIWVNSRRRT